MNNSTAHRLATLESKIPRSDPETEFRRLAHEHLKMFSIEQLKLVSDTIQRRISGQDVPTEQLAESNRLLAPFTERLRAMRGQTAGCSPQEVAGHVAL